MFLAGGLALNLAIGLAAGVAAGWWPVAAFEGGAFALFAVILACLTANRAREVVTVHERTVAVEYGRRRLETRIELDRYWARVESCRNPRPALVVRSRGVSVEIARALDEEARAALAARLRELLGPTAVGPAARISGPMPSGQL